MEMGGGRKGELGVSVNSLWGRVVQMDHKGISILMSPPEVVFPPPKKRLFVRMSVRACVNE